jgi:hypothetical protein
MLAGRNEKCLRGPRILSIGCSARYNEGLLLRLIIGLEVPNASEIRQNTMESAIARPRQSQFALPLTFHLLNSEHQNVQPPPSGVSLPDQLSQPWSWDEPWRLLPRPVPSMHNPSPFRLPLQKPSPLLWVRFLKSSHHFRCLDNRPRMKHHSSRSTTHQPKFHRLSSWGVNMARRTMRIRIPWICYVTMRRTRSTFLGKEAYSF